MIDLHCHILPGIDDGPATLDESLALARAAVAAGTVAIVATPHVNHRHQENSAALIAERVAELRATLAERDISLALHTGAEIALTHSTELSDEELVDLRLGGPGGTHLLVECPTVQSSAGFEALLGLLRHRGHEVVIAHPERCPAFLRDPEAYAKLVDQGMLGQITAGALVGQFGRVVRDLGHRFLREGLAHVVASDAHSAERRPPAILSCLNETGYARQADWLGRAVPQAVLTGASPPPAPEMPSRQRAGLAGRLRH